MTYDPQQGKTHTPISEPRPADVAERKNVRKVLRASAECIRSALLDTKVKEVAIKSVLKEAKMTFQELFDTIYWSFHKAR